MVSECLFPARFCIFRYKRAIETCQRDDTISKKKNICIYGYIQNDNIIYLIN